MSTNETIWIAAPAKINLGLEIIGKRADGYHEIRTVMAMIDLADLLSIRRMGFDRGLQIDGVHGVATDANLIARAIRAFEARIGSRSGYEVSIEKVIPSPGGLGGASSDAAATLLALNHLHGHPITSDELAVLAATLGSDVPFFLGTPVALASGTGTTLSALASITGSLVLVVPRLELEAKTPTLYRALREEDFSDGATVNEVAETIEGGRLPAPALLRNAFARPLVRIAPQLEEIQDGMLRAGASHVALSGAGPAHYAFAESEADANDLAERMRHSLPAGTRIIPTRFLPVQPLPEQRSA